MVDVSHVSQDKTLNIAAFLTKLLRNLDRKIDVLLQVFEAEMVKLWLTVGPDLYSLYQVVHDESEDWQRALQSLDVNRGDCIFLIAELIV